MLEIPLSTTEDDSNDSPLLGFETKNVLGWGTGNGAFIFSEKAGWDTESSGLLQRAYISNLDYHDFI